MLSLVATYVVDHSRRLSEPHLFVHTTSGLELFSEGYNINITLTGKQFSVRIDSGGWLRTRRTHPH